ncbi:endonuclease III [Mycoplasmatota bacterium WC44]
MNKILHVFDDMFPDAECELTHTNEFELLVAVMLSAQSTDASVNKLTIDLFKKYKGPKDFVQVPISELENDLKQIGLYRNKAKSIKETSKILLEKFDGKVPSTMKELTSLKGVGRKTANVVLSVAFNIPSIPVDTHVDRVSKRLGLANENDNVLEVEKKLMEVIPKDKWNSSHHQFIFFGRYHCTARNPKCDQCDLISECVYNQTKYL